MIMEMMCKEIGQKMQRALNDEFRIVFVITYIFYLSVRFSSLQISKHFMHFSPKEPCDFRLINLSKTNFCEGSFSIGKNDIKLNFLFQNHPT